MLLWSRYANALILCKYSAVSRQPSAYFIQKLFGVACAMGINCSGSVATALLADS
ncbi:MAG: hypothetical protein F6K56_36760 [Moorea sp. SIO3G5]|nr:hypothetical protein [Moorena sp. SIO3G5]